MSRFRDIVRGARARETLTLQIHDAETRLDLRVLSTDEESDVISRARARAIAKGLVDPKAGEPLYDIAIMSETVFSASRVVGGEDPFFDTVADVTSLDRDTIQYIYQAHSLFTDRCSPRLMKMSPEEFVAGIAVLAGEDSESIRFFERLGSGMQWIYTRTLARQAVISQTLRSESGSTSEATGKP